MTTQQRAFTIARGYAKVEGECPSPPRDMMTDLWRCLDCNWIGNRPKEEVDYQEGWEEPWTARFCPECGEHVAQWSAESEAEEMMITEELRADKIVSGAVHLPDLSIWGWNPAALPKVVKTGRLIKPYDSWAFGQYMGRSFTRKGAWRKMRKLCRQS